MPGSSRLRRQLNRLIIYLQGKSVGCRRQIARPPGPRGILEGKRTGPSCGSPAQFRAQVFDFQRAEREQTFLA